jgi:hypothetical protein
VDQNKLVVRGVGNNQQLNIGNDWSQLKYGGEVIRRLVGPKKHVRDLMVEVLKPQQPQAES